MSQGTSKTSVVGIDPEQVAAQTQRWARPLTESLSDGFVALYLYGSALEPGWDPKRSDVNLLLVAKAMPATTIRSLSEVWPRGGPMGAPANLVAMAADQVLRAGDTFALEFSEVKNRGRLLAGEDIVAGLEIPADSLRHHLEREIRVLNVRLRRVYLESRDDGKSLVAALADAVGTVVAVARGVSYLRGSQIPLTAESALESAADWAGTEPRPWLEAWHIRRDSNPPITADSLFLDFLDATSQLMRRVDTHTGEE